MKINRIQLYQVAIPLNFTFAQSNNSGSKTSNSVIVQLFSEDGICGYGECCPRTYVTGEDVHSVIADLEKGQSALYSANAESHNEWINELDQLEIGNSTRCALELAWLDLWSKSTGALLPDMLSITFPESYQYSLVLPLLSLDSLKKLGQRISVFQPSSIKLKVNSDLESQLPKIDYIRKLFGTDCPIRLDINSGWRIEQAMRMIPAYLNKGINSFEQPLLEDDITGMSQLTQEFGSECILMIDESLLDDITAQQHIDQDACNHFNLKLSKLGGISNSKRIYEMASQSNIPCQLGAHFGESSILSAGALLLSGMVQGLSNIEGGLGKLLLKEDITDTPIQQDHAGRIFPKSYFNKPGLVSNIDHTIIEKYTLLQRSWNLESIK